MPIHELSPKDQWRRILGELEMQLPRPTFETWLKPTEGLSSDDRNFVVEVPSPFYIEWLERRIYQTIQRTVEKLMGAPLEVTFQVRPDALAPPGTYDDDDRPERLPGAAIPHAPQSARYNFKKFVVGPSNQLAYNASRAVVDSIGLAYNPLFIYSGVGLGKTHLLNAIADACFWKGYTVIYLTCEQFTNEFIGAIRNGTTEDFRQRYRQAHALLIDDVQFLGGKDQTQEAFFHIFNELHGSGRQIVLTSDRPPKSLGLLEDRLRSRFEGGLTVDIQAPDLETRMAILDFKARDMEIFMDDRLLEMIAKRVQHNIRELEGVLTRLVAYSRWQQPQSLGSAGSTVTREVASRVLDDLAANSPRHQTDPQRILLEVARHYRLTVAELLGKGRTKKVALARQVTMYLLHTDLEMAMSATDVGRLLGGRDHSTVIHGAGKISAEINEDPHLRQDVLTIKEAIFSAPLPNDITR
ncbi:MAG: chromosomal replication initiator protein DnaA [Dehalococcoidia bacterium]|nr:chromosomal replication initiator protein DnaA [Dehalococcoidia bacterium]